MHPLPQVGNNQNPAEAIIGNVMNFLAQGSHAGYMHPQTAPIQNSNLQNVPGNPFLHGSTNFHAPRYDHTNQHYETIQPITDTAWTSTTTDTSSDNAQLDSRTDTGTTTDFSSENTQLGTKAETSDRDRKRRHSPSPP